MIFQWKFSLSWLPLIAQNGNFAFWLSIRVVAVGNAVWAAVETPCRRTLHPLLNKQLTFVRQEAPVGRTALFFLQTFWSIRCHSFVWNPNGNLEKRTLSLKIERAWHPVHRSANGLASSRSTENSNTKIHIKIHFSLFSTKCWKITGLSRMIQVNSPCWIHSTAIWLVVITVFGTLCTVFLTFWTFLSALIRLFSITSSSDSSFQSFIWSSLNSFNLYALNSRRSGYLYAIRNMKRLEKCWKSRMCCCRPVGQIERCLSAMLVRWTEIQTAHLVAFSRPTTGCTIRLFCKAPSVRWST